MPWMSHCLGAARAADFQGQRTKYAKMQWNGENGMRLKSVCFISVVYCMGYSLQWTSASASQQTPEDLAQLWVEAIKTNSTAKIRPLIHPACPQNSVSPEALARMGECGLPATYV